MTEPGTPGAAPAPAPPQPPSRRPWLRPLLLLAVVAVLLVLARVFGLGEKFGLLQDWIEGLGPVGPVVFLGLYILAVVAAIPGSAITLAAGALFGTVLGVILVSVGSTTPRARTSIAASRMYHSCFLSTNLTRSLKDA
ncbi:MAG: hypothetical protein O7D96_05715, partial [SAR324 cluster bacterium]|nr:hypothetical protein [SAR324 cluster bacterium]